MTILQTILNFIAQLLNRRGSPSVIVPTSKAPPTINPIELSFWLKEEVAKKGHFPQGYEPIADNPNTPENERRTYCNFFVRSTLKTKFGYFAFETTATDQAGEMLNYMESHSDQWKKLECMAEYNRGGQGVTKLGPDYEGAVKWASQGCLVVAAWKNPQYPAVLDAHVCIIAPENVLCASSKWGRNVPLAANVGADNWYGKALSWAFGEEPNLYLFLGA